MVSARNLKSHPFCQFAFDNLNDKLKRLVYFENEAISKRTLISGDEFQIGKFHLLFIGSK
jgi:hypothetical protein